MRRASPGTLRSCDRPLEPPDRPSERRLPSAGLVLLTPDRAVNRRSIQRISIGRPSFPHPAVPTDMCVAVFRG
jgi:hypothetical protein